MSVVDLDKAALERATLPEIRSRRILELKTLEDGAAPGTFEAIVSVFGNVDSYGDRMMPGAFTRTLEERGFPAVVWSHMWFEPPIGASLEAEELDKGLRIVGQLFVDDNQRAREVYAAMKNTGGDGKPPLREFSFAYFTRGSQLVEEPIDAENPDAGTREVREITDVDLIEVGPTLLGANPATELLDVASHGDRTRRREITATELATASAAYAIAVKAGAVLSAANRERIEKAVEHLTTVLDAATPEDDGKARAERVLAIREMAVAFPR